MQARTGVGRRLVTLGLGLAVVAAPTVLRAAGLSRVPSAGEVFAAGVASGMPESGGFVLWTRIFGVEPDDPSPVAVRWEVADESGDSSPVAQGVFLAQKAWGHSVHVEVSGLRPGRWYRYRFMAGDAVSPWGRTRTLPAGDQAVGALRLAYASCQRWEDGHYAAYRHMRDEAVDMVVFLGDYIYEYRSRPSADAVRTHSLRHARTLQDYRDRYALYRSDPDLQRMHAACPWLVTWDDHEVENNYAGVVSTSGTVNLDEQRAAAYQAFYENMPIRRDVWDGGARADGVRVHHRLDFGRLARIHLLDNRQYREIPGCGSNPSDRLRSVCARQLDPRSSMLGREQERWLRAGLEGAAHQGVAWNLLGQETRFTPRNYGAGLGNRYSTDTWDGYPHARQRLTDALRASGASNPVIIGGDIHQNWVAHVHADPYDVGSPVVASEFCGTSISSRSGTPQDVVERVARMNPHCLLANSQHRGYGLIDLDVRQMTVRLRVVDEVANPSSGVSTLAGFRVESGSPQIEKV